MEGLPICEVVIVSPEVSVVYHEACFPSFLAQVQLVAHLLLVVQRKSIQFYIHTPVPFNSMLKK